MSLYTNKMYYYYNFIIHNELVNYKPLPSPAHLQALQHVEEVVHPRQAADVLEDGHQQRGRDGDGAREQHPRKARPAQVQEALEENNI